MLLKAHNYIPQGDYPQLEWTTSRILRISRKNLKYDSSMANNYYWEK